MIASFQGQSRILRLDDSIPMTDFDSATLVYNLAYVMLTWRQFGESFENPQDGQVASNAFLFAQSTKYHCGW